MKKIMIGMTLMAILASCQKNENKPQNKENDSTVVTTEQQEDYTLIGKKGLLVYPEFKAEVSYLSDSTLHWKTTQPDGSVHEGDEQIFFKKLNDHQYFLNWIEQDGLSISQVIDVKAKTVTAFGTFADDKSPRGKRSSMNLEGTFEFIN